MIDNAPRSHFRSSTHHLLYLLDCVQRQLETIREMADALAAADDDDDDKEQNARVIRPGSSGTTDRDDRPPI